MLSLECGLFSIRFIRLTECNYLVGSWSSGSRRPEEAIDDHCAWKELAKGNFSRFIVYDRVTPIVTSPLSHQVLYISLYTSPSGGFLRGHVMGFYCHRGETPGRYFICDVRSFTAINHSLPWIFRESFIRFVFQPCTLHHKQ